MARSFVTPPCSQVDDVALVAGLACGDEEAFRLVVSRHHKELRGLARRFVRDLETAEDVVQETWTIVLSHIQSFEGRGSLKAWISQILVNQAKARAIREARMPLSTVAPPADFTLRAADEELLAKERLGVVSAAILALPPTQRLVLTLRDVLGVGAAEVCGQLELTAINQRVLLHRARAQVRRAIEEYEHPGPTTMAA